MTSATAQAPPASPAASQPPAARRALRVARFTSRRGRGGAAGWAAFGLLGIIGSLGAYRSAYPDEASRESFAALLQGNAAFSALLGPAYDVTTAGGFAAWRLQGPLTAAISAWMLLFVTRMLRGEEQAGRAESVLARPITMPALTRAVVAGAGFNLLAVWLVLTAATLALSGPFELSPLDAVLMVSAMCATAAVFGALGALFSQVFPTRGSAAGAAAGVLGIAYATRSIADVVASLGWLRWVTPIGWTIEVRAFSGARPALLLLHALVTALLVFAAIQTSRRRDFGAALIRLRDESTAPSRLLGSEWTAALRFARPGTLGFAAGVGAYTALLSSIAKAVGDLFEQSDFRDVFESLGLADLLGTPGYIAFATFFVLAIVTSVVAATHLERAVEDERSGRCDIVLSQPLARGRWLASRVLAGAVSIAVVAVVATAVATAVTTATGAGLRVTSMLAAGAETVPIGLLFLGLGTVGYGFNSRLSTVAVYGLVGTTALLQLVGEGLRLPAWLLSISPYSHLSGAPAVPVDPVPPLVIGALGVVSSAIGVALFVRRDLTT